MQVTPRLLYASMAGIAIALALLGVLTTYLNIRRKWREVHTTRRVNALRPQLLDALEGDESALESGWAARDRSTFVALSRRLLPTLRGADRDRIVELLEQHGVIDTALLDLHARSAIRRARAADLLGTASVPRSVPDLVALLEDRDADVRRTAARALGMIGDAVAVGPLLATIDSRRSVPLNTVTMALLRVDHEALEPLMEGLRVGSAGVRAICAELLGVRGSIAAVPQLCAALGHREALEVRIRAARALGRIGAPGSVDGLADAMRTDQPAALRAVATRALGQIGGHRTVSLLRDALDAPEHMVASNAARALATVGDDGARVLVKVGQEALTSRGAYAREALAYSALATSSGART
jgi:hypothetical protein